MTKHLVPLPVAIHAIQVCMGRKKHTVAVEATTANQQPLASKTQNSSDCHHQHQHQPYLVPPHSAYVVPRPVRLLLEHGVYDLASCIEGYADSVVTASKAEQPGRQMANGLPATNDEVVSVVDARQVMRAALRAHREAEQSPVEEDLLSWKTKI